jgi:hypothetical protein
MLFAENLIVEKRRENLHIRECRGMQKPVIQWIRVGSYLKIFLHCLRAEMIFLCK